jgi:hypothetical protein
MKRTRSKKSRDTVPLRDAVQTMEQGRIEVPCVNGDADKIRSETVLKMRIFFLFTLQLFSRSEHLVRKLIDALKIGRSFLIRIAFNQTNCLFILLERAEMEIRFSMANSMFKTKMDIDRHGPRFIANNLNPPYFSLPTTFKTFFSSP